MALANASVNLTGELTSKRVKIHVTSAEPRTTLGRNIKRQTDVPPVLLDRIVRDVATTKLKQFRGRGKPS